MNITKLSTITLVNNEESNVNFILDKVNGANLINGISKDARIVNDYSTDDTEEVIEKYFSKKTSFEIQYLKHECNK